MAIVGSTEEKKELLRGYEQDPMAAYAEQFLDIAKSGLQEGVNFFDDPSLFLRKSSTRDAMKDFFIKESYDPGDPKFQDSNPFGGTKALDEHMSNMEALFSNDSDKILNESNALGAFNPVIGMALPIHKNILMNAVFDQVMPKDVAKSPKFTLTLETRHLYDTEGNDIDLFLEQNKIKDAVDNSVPQMDVIINLPEYKTIDILKDKFGLTGSKAHLSIRTAITGLVVNSYVAKGESYYDTTTSKIATVADDASAGVKPVIMETGTLGFASGYGPDDRQLHKVVSLKVKTSATDSKTISGTLMGTMTKDGKFVLSFAAPTADAALVTAARMHAVVDVSSAGFKTVKVNWSAETTPFEIPEAPHITVEVTPEEVKDIQANYDVNQITKLMSMMNLVLLHWKDNSILEDLNESFLTMPDNQKVSAAIDFAGPTSFLGTPRQWRSEMFMDQFDSYATRMLNVLNDENMTFLIFGRPEIIRRIVPTQYTYQTPSNIGPVELDFTRTVVSTDKRVYNFVSTQKMRDNNNLIVLLCPRNTMRITYKIIDYQLYVSNEIRSTDNYELPAMTCFERWLFLQYQPVQGRIQVMNVMGTREQIENPDPIGNNAMNDNTANYSTYASTVNGVAKTAGDFVGQAAKK